jgi:hypothetical protein
MPFQFRGRGAGNPVGAPLEAVVHDLCATREALDALVIEVKGMRADLAAQNAAVVDMLSQVLAATRDGLAEAETFRAEMGETRRAAESLRGRTEEVRDELRRRPA